MLRTGPLPWWLTAIVVLGALLMAAGAIIALVRPVMLVSPSDQINGAVHIYAGYLVSRNLAIALMLLAALFRRATGTLRILMLLTALIQFLDAGMDCLEARWTLVPGILLLGAVFLWGAIKLSNDAPGRTLVGAIPPAR